MKNQWERKYNGNILIIMEYTIIEKLREPKRSKNEVE